MTSKNSVPLLGAHISTAGGVASAFARGAQAGCATMQIFTRNQTQWRSPPLPQEEIARFRAEQERTGIAPVVAHGSYLVNLASPDPVLLGRSRGAFLEELRRAAALGLTCVVTHPGAHRGAGVAAGLARAVESLDWLAERAAAGGPLICLENTAGQGTMLGGDFAHLGALLAGVKEPGRLGVCLDSCHGHAAGYDFASPAGYEQALGALEAAVGPGRVLALHLNDAKGERGSHLDRHEHIGRGRIGRAGFRLFMNDPRFARVPKIIETPKEEGGRQMDPVNLGVLRRLAGRGPGGVNPRRRG
ncbi:MAG TPA: deoxyribonuclease IV [Candidatus Methanoperedens sp.]|nr:deoxyribonuclease IV [Candidatus Methanoperedens sp.]